MILKASKLNCDVEFFKEKKTYLCKICQGDWTTNKIGICTMCQEHLDYNRENKIIDWVHDDEVDNYIKELGFKTIDEFYDDMEKKYAEEENIEVINDIGQDIC